jgi:diguanylate cyclase (GGDEF)-like protein
VETLKSIAEKLRVLVEYSRFDLPEMSLSVTISVGATLLQPSDTHESVIRRADELLYKSKRNGRNQVSIG